ncbi:MAG: leucyl aminopeptidase family protein [Gammaproteobacteria bacterium]|nr:leucyl aminopeptidase family protein [Gammaproteobacteria bacterium]
MTATLPRPPRLSVSAVDGAATPQRLQKLDHLLILAPDNMATAKWQNLPAATELLRSRKQIVSKSAFPAAQTQLRNTARTVVSVGLLSPKATPFERLSGLRRMLGQLLKSNPVQLGVLVSGFNESMADDIAAALSLTALSAVSILPSRKSKTPRKARLRSIQLFGAKQPDLARLRAENEGNHLARWLTALPPNDLDSARYRELIADLAQQHGWEMKFLDCRRLAKLNAGAFLAVAQAGDKNAGIVHLRYRPKNKKSQPDLALVGKGICFDTGGVNLKPARGMQNMHDDMQGSAVALGALTALSRMKSELNVDCWLAISENLIGPDAYKPMDVVTASNGTSIEIIHTDAEGRMVLADTLALAAIEKPKVMIDYATLTGACVGALTERYSGAFSNRSALNPLLIKAGEDSGERVWPFPMDSDFDTALDSSMADIKQCTLDGLGDHILAARFLSRFAGSSPWIHIDLSAGRYKGGLGAIATDVTGFGVHLTMNLLHEQDLLEQKLD